MLFITLVLFVAVLLGLNYLYRSTQKLGQTVFVGLLLGLVGGALLQSLSEQETVKTALDWINLVGGGYVRLLQMIVMPLVFVSILSAITRLNQAGSLGKISFSVLSVLLVTTAIAALIGIIMVKVFGLTAEGLVAGERELAAQAKVVGRVDQVSNLSIPVLSLELIFFPVQQIPINILRYMHCPKTRFFFPLHPHTSRNILFIQIYHKPIAYRLNY